MYTVHKHRWFSFKTTTFALITSITNRLNWNRIVNFLFQIIRYVALWYLWAELIPFHQTIQNKQQILRYLVFMSCQNFLQRDINVYLNNEYIYIYITNYLCKVLIWYLWFETQYLIYQNDSKFISCLLDCSMYFICINC